MTTINPLIQRYHVDYWREPEPPHAVDVCPGCNLGHDACTALDCGRQHILLIAEVDFSEQGMIHATSAQKQTLVYRNDNDPGSNDTIWVTVEWESGSGIIPPPHISFWDSERWSDIVFRYYGVMNS